VILAVRQLAKSFGLGSKRLAVVDGISFEVPLGGWTTILGPSGCGKTTLLRILAGLELPDAGTIHSGLPGTSLRHASAYLPQADTLLPWRTALGNAVLALELAGVPQPEARSEARELFHRFGLEGFEDRYPVQLSGGMRQRVAIIRTFLAHREVLLLDEPLGSLDPLTRMRLQDWLTEIWQELGKTILLVTHDVEEALLLSDRILLLSDRPATVRESIDLDWPRPRDRGSDEISAKRGAILVQLLERGSW